MDRKETEAIFDAAMLYDDDAVRDLSRLREMMRDVRENIASEEEFGSFGPSMTCEKTLGEFENEAENRKTEPLLESSKLYEEPYIKLVRVV